MALLDPSLSGQLGFLLSVSSVVGIGLFWPIRAFCPGRGRFGAGLHGHRGCRSGRVAASWAGAWKARACRPRRTGCPGRMRGLPGVNVRDRRLVVWERLAGGAAGKPPRRSRPGHPHAPGVGRGGHKPGSLLWPISLRALPGRWPTPSSRGSPGSLLWALRASPCRWTLGWPFWSPFFCLRSFSLRGPGPAAACLAAGRSLRLPLAGAVLLPPALACAAARLRP